MRARRRCDFTTILLCVTSKANFESEITSTFDARTTFFSAHCRADMIPDSSAALFEL
eukprot:NODE_13080_length_250_cov_1.200000.p2 GENE.NODE_13080_length_250_cov_1.200000~~NODE_13080_length_250_cov_1.200000.p2  ORF type:complete len:57 (+),score=6.56 NODE_13080_length_250_cov_1.200000:53-223(+)